jgi:hypothetical protein
VEKRWILAQPFSKVEKRWKKGGFWLNLSQRLILAQPFSKVDFGSTFPKG